MICHIFLERQSDTSSDYNIPGPMQLQLPKIEGCTEQMYKHDQKEANLPPSLLSTNVSFDHADSSPDLIEPLPDTVGESVYDRIIPFSISCSGHARSPALTINPPNEMSMNPITIGVNSEFDDTTHPYHVMPLVRYFLNSTAKPLGWHRIQERLCRGSKPLRSITAQFEPWERQLVMFETMLLSGTGWNATEDLSHAWGRENGFHIVLVNQICERRGVLEKKKRRDSGNMFSPKKNRSFKEGLKRRRREAKVVSDNDGTSK